MNAVIVLGILAILLIITRRGTGRSIGENVAEVGIGLGEKLIGEPILDPLADAAGDVLADAAKWATTNRTFEAYIREATAFLERKGLSTEGPQNEMLLRAIRNGFPKYVEWKEG